MANDLQIHLIEHIKKHGPIPLGKFIEIAMTHPQFGYYSSESVYPIGKQGDFVTSPEISQMFGEMIGVWVIDIWSQMGEEEITLIECGPGQGTLMADILRVARKIPDFLKKVQIRFIEASKALKKIQNKAIEKYINPKQISWSNSISNPKGACIILGNEFLDALPIEQVIRKNGKWHQRVIDLTPEEKTFYFSTQIMSPELKPFLPKHACDNEIYEISPERIRFTKECLRITKEHSSVALFIDYGHNKSHYGDTLQAVRKHEYTHILEDIGKSDITTHVDFESLVRVIKQQGVRCKPIITQGHFLEKLGIKHRAQALRMISDAHSEEIDMALDRLISPKQMGDLFKVLCFYSGNIKPAGF